MKTTSLYKVFKGLESVPVFTTRFKSISLLYLTLFCRDAQHKCLRHGNGTTPIIEGGRIGL
jgi:hypothetical protein